MTIVTVKFGGKTAEGEVLRAEQGPAGYSFLVDVKTKGGASMGVMPFYAEDIVDSPAAQWVRASNADMRAWERAEAGRVALLLVESASHWAAYGVLTVEQLNAYEDAEAEKEARKSAY